MRSTTGQEIRETVGIFGTRESGRQIHLPMCCHFAPMISWFFVHQRATASFRFPYSALCDVVQGSDQRPRKDFKSAEGNLVGVRPPRHQNKHSKMNKLQGPTPLVKGGCSTFSSAGDIYGDNSLLFLPSDAMSRKTTARATGVWGKEQGSGVGGYGPKQANSSVKGWAKE